MENVDPQAQIAANFTFPIAFPQVPIRFPPNTNQNPTRKGQMAAKTLKKKWTKTDYLNIGSKLHEGRKGKPAGNDTKAVTGIVATFAKDAASYTATRDEIVAEIQRIFPKLETQEARTSADQRAKPLGYKTTKARAGKASGTVGEARKMSSIGAFVSAIEDLQVQFVDLPKSEIAEFCQIGENTTNLAAFMELQFQQTPSEKDYKIPRELAAFFAG